MPYNFTALFFSLVLLPFVSVAQRYKMRSVRNLDQPTFIYYNFYHDVQMIEVSYAASWNKRRSTPEAMKPTAIPWEAKNPMPPSAYVFRNHEGAIIKQYMTHTEKFTAAIFTKPGAVKTIAHKHIGHGNEIESLFNRELRILSSNAGNNKIDRTTCTADMHYRYKVFSSSGMVGLIDTLGNLVADTIYTDLTCADSIYYFGLNYKMGIMTKDFIVVFPSEHDAITYFDKGLYSVTDYHYYGFVDKNGKPVTPVKYYGSSGEFVDGLLLVLEIKTNKGNKWGFIDSTGKEVIELKYESLQPFRNGLAIAEINDKYGFIDKNDKPVVDFKYEYVRVFNKGYSIVKRNGMYGMINMNAEEVIPCEYSYLDEFSEGLAIARKTGSSNVGFINEKNEIIIPFMYDNAWAFKNGKARVHMDKKEIYINSQGKEVPAGRK